MVRFALAGLVITAEIISTDQDLVGNILVFMKHFLIRLPCTTMEVIGNDLVSIAYLI